MHIFDPSSQAPLIGLIALGLLPPEQVPAAHELTQLHFNRKQWSQFIDLLILWLGGLGRLAKLSMAEVFMVTCITAYWRWHQHATVSKTCSLEA
ncbi:MAG TPA: hypothetical protein VLC79_08360 [Cellvibrio sp.]|nr:hypothetical protein [Cellvibrio sp.]